MSQILEDKDPSDRKDYSIEWATLLAGQSDTAISVSSWVVHPSGLTIHSMTTSDLKAIIWITGGVAGQDYGLENTIVTGNGRIHQRTITVPVRER
jgi:hypothetical protein